MLKLVVVTWTSFSEAAKKNDNQSNHSTWLSFSNAYSTPIDVN